jgi:phosphopantothenoylcysteine decarboxylase/phosphopantothenate--cysteine ligase
MHDATREFRCLLTAGPTREHLDPVRFLSNGSSGKMGYALAESALARGWHVDLVSGPVSLTASAGIRLHRVTSAEEMHAACLPLFAACDLFIAVAAVADYRPAHADTEKAAKAPGGRQLALVPTVDILRTMAAVKRPGQIVVGFAAETHDVEARAWGKLERKRLDWIVANDVSRPESGMNADDNTIILLGANGDRRVFGPATKRLVADFILRQIVSN